MKKQTGFTIIEMMILMAVIGVVASLAVPSFGELIKNNRIAAQSNNLIASLQYARGETVSRGVSIKVIPIAGAGTDWATGWQIGIDDNDDDDFADAGDEVLRSYEKIENGTLISTQSTIVFNPGGDVTNAANLTLQANNCATGEEFKRIVQVKASGLINLSSDKSCP